MLKLRDFLLVPLCLAGTSCGDSSPEPEKVEAEKDIAQAPPVVAPTPAHVPEVIRDEEPAEPESTETAAEVVRTYFDHLEAGRYGEAWEMRAVGGKPPQSREQFATHFEQYERYRATVGTPSRTGAAAGSVYVEVPVHIYGRYKNGKSFTSAGTITLRRSNNIPGATAQQRQWHIYTGG